MHNFIEKLFGWAYHFFKIYGFKEPFVSYISLLINLFLLATFAYFVYFIFSGFLIRVLVVLARKSKNKLDNILITNNTHRYVSHLIPFVFIYKSVPIILNDFIYWETVFGRLVEMYIVILILWIIRTFFSSIRDYLKLKVSYQDKPIDSFIQVIMILLWIIGITVILSKLFDISTQRLLTALGAVSALIILIFRDTILGFVASVQVSINDMVRIGDWITMPKFGADGDVIEINLATVKVRNFDNTTTTIPTYSLISDSFQNWRGMLNSGGRRIKRHILIKSNSIHFLKNSELIELKKIHLIQSYLEQMEHDINRYNSGRQIDKSLAINGRNLTNFGVFRKYITKYLENHPGINKKMVLMCRQLQPTSQGIPLEIYAFSTDKRFENYEYIMADIFDHIIASVEYFDLEIFEMSAGKINPTD